MDPIIAPAWKQIETRRVLTASQQIKWKAVGHELLTCRAGQGFIINKSYQNKSYYFDQLVDVEKLQTPHREHGK